MSYEPKDNTGSLFRNETRETDSHPNARGSCLIDGVEYWVDSWTNEIKNGEKAGQKYQSLKFKKKEPKREMANDTRSRMGQRGPKPTGRQYDDDDAPPF